MKPSTAECTTTHQAWFELSNHGQSASVHCNVCLSLVATIWTNDPMKTGREAVATVRDHNAGRDSSGRLEMEGWSK